MTVEKFAGVHPKLVGVVQRILAAMAALEHPMIVTDGLRTQEEQAALYAKGRTAPGAIVTNADGVHGRSNHQAHEADGYGHAIDCAFLVDGKPSWEDGHPWALYGLMAQTLGLTWGGTFKSLPDRPHVELRDQTTRA